MSIKTVGFVGLGRLGLPMAFALLDAGFNVLCTARGRSAELVERGGAVAGDGTARALAEMSDLVVSCLPSGDSLREVVAGPSGLCSAEHIPPVAELSTLPVGLKAELRQHLVAHGSDMLDAPVSGTPAMVAARIAVIYASGDSSLHGRSENVLRAISPHYVFVGEFGTGTKMKLVAQFLGLIHVTAAAEAMVYAKLAGLDLHQVTELISSSPGAVSGQFKIRAPLMAAREFDGKLVTVAMTLQDLNEIRTYGEEIAAPLDLLAVAESHFKRLAENGHADADPCRLFDALADEAELRRL